MIKEIDNGFLQVTCNKCNKTEEAHHYIFKDVIFNTFKWVKCGKKDKHFCPKCTPKKRKKKNKTKGRF